jgi:hypothetical protein
VASRRGPDNSVRVSISGTLRGNNWANIFHAQLTTSSAISQADLDTWTAAFALAYENRFKSLLSSDTTVTLAKTVLYTPGGGELISSSVRSQAGTSANVSLVGAVSKVVSWLSGVYWRGGKPRTYLPGTTAVEITAGTDTMTGAILTAMQTAAAGFRTDVNALTAGTITGTTLGFVSFRTGNAERVTPLFFAITGAKIHPHVGIQRRRDGKWLN